MGPDARPCSPLSIDPQAIYPQRVTMDSALQAVIERVYRKYFPGMSTTELGEKMGTLEEWCRQPGCSVLELTDPVLSRLGEIYDPPELLFAHGDVGVLRLPSLGVVGTRRPTPYGRRAVRLVSSELVRAGVCILSGLAHGIDADAHRSALEASGKTIAVLAHGLDTVYPHANRSLAEGIRAGGGVLLSEYPLGVSPLRHHFPARNRLISGLSRGVVIIEAAMRSGSLITAQSALDQGRDVFVVPGGYDMPSFEGSHELIQQGAKLIRRASDILDEIRGVSAREFDGCSLADAEMQCPRLRSLFEISKGVLSLEEIYEKLGEGDSELSAEWLLAQRLGRVVEVEPQQFIWCHNFWVSGHI